MGSATHGVEEISHYCVELVLTSFHYSNKNVTEEAILFSLSSYVYIHIRYYVRRWLIQMLSTPLKTHSCMCLLAKNTTNLQPTKQSSSLLSSSSSSSSSSCNLYQIMMYTWIQTANILQSQVKY